jgi:ABC-type antimicrobial peptide transport system permease subunit
VFVFRAPGMLGALLGWSSLYPTFTLAPGTDATSLATIAACTVAPYIAAAAIPAWRAATLDPAEAMR